MAKPWEEAITTIEAAANKHWPIRNTNPLTLPGPPNNSFILFLSLYRYNYIECLFIYHKITYKLLYNTKTLDPIKLSKLMLIFFMGIDYMNSSNLQKEKKMEFERDMFLRSSITTLSMTTQTDATLF